MAATRCTISRYLKASPRRSSINDTDATSKAATASQPMRSDICPDRYPPARTSATASTIAIPPVRGVGRECSDRSFGWSRMCNREKGFANECVSHAAKANTRVASSTGAHSTGNHGYSHMQSDTTAHYALRPVSPFAEPTGVSSISRRSA